MQFFHLTEGRYIIHLTKRYSWEYFRDKAKVAPGTYSEVFARRLYSSVFDNAIDLKREFLKYYKDEYESIDQFVFWRYGISEEIFIQIPNASDGYLAVFGTEWQMEDDDLLRDSFVAIFKELGE